MTVVRTIFLMMDLVFLQAIYRIHVVSTGAQHETKCKQQEPVMQTSALGWYTRLQHRQWLILVRTLLLEQNVDKRLTCMNMRFNTCAGITGAGKNEKENPVPKKRANGNKVREKHDIIGDNRELGESKEKSIRKTRRGWNRLLMLMVR